MSINDRLRVRIFASTLDRQYGSLEYGGATYGGNPWAYGTEEYGDFDYGRRMDELAPGGKPFNCYITSMTLETGRQRPLDQNRIGVCSVQLVQMDVPNDWIAEIGYQTPAAVVLGRTMIVESLNEDIWSAVFTGTIETAVAEYQGTGTFEQPTMKWEIVALDNLNRLARVIEAPGITWRPEELANVRLEALAARVSLGVRYLSTTMPYAELHPIEDLNEANLLVHMQNTAKYGFRLAAAQYGSDIDVEDLNVGAYISNILGAVFISSPHMLWPNAPVRLFLPCPTSVRSSWVVDRLLNQVTVLSPDVPTDPTPNEYVQTDAVSIDAYGRRTYEDNVPTVEMMGVSTPAISLAQKILSAYKDPKPWITSAVIDFTEVIDLDTFEPTWDGLTTYGNYEVGFAYAIRMLRGTRILALTLPGTDGDRTLIATGYVYGIIWTVNADTVSATVYLEANPERYGTVAVPAPPPPEPEHPTGNEAISFGMKTSGWSILPRMTFTIPATVVATDVEIDMDLYDPGNGQSYFFRSPTTLNVPRAQGYIDYTVNRLKLEGTNAAGTVQGSAVNIPYSALHRKRLYMSVAPQVAPNSAVQYQVLEPGDPVVGTITLAPTASAQEWFKPGNQVSLGWEGPTGGWYTYMLLFGLQIRKKSTGQILLDVRPQDWAAGSWTDPYGNVISITESVRYDDDVPDSIMGS